MMISPQNEITHDEVSEMTALVHHLLHRCKTMDPWFMDTPKVSSLQQMAYEFDLRIQRQGIEDYYKRGLK